ncbi:MAG: hypothetical protein LBU85_13320 [Treponema sp.]|jgi:hypothetical protein|nr:hypothetical protein [Treponema sp.]
MNRTFFILLLLFLIFSCKGRNNNTTDNNADDDVSISEQEMYPDLSTGWNRFDINLDYYNLDLKSYIEEHPNLSKVIICFKDYQSIDFSLLSNMKNLNNLTIDCYDDSLSQIPDLSGLKNLRRLEISGSIKSFENIDEHLPDIEYFQFCPNSRNDDYWELEIKNFHEISKITSLKKIFLQMGSEKQEINFLQLQGLTNLESFETFSGGVIDFKGIENLKQLKQIKASYCTPRNTGYLGNLGLLQELELRIVNGNIKFLENIKTLETLRLYNYEYDSNAGPHDGLKKYQTKIDLYSMRNLKTLNFVSLSGFIIDNVYIIDELSSLDDVYFCDCFVLPDDSTEKINTYIYRNFIPDGK